MKKIGPLGQGHNWERHNDLILIALPDKKEISQVHIIRPDGSKVRCLTCKQVAGGPPVGVHKGVPFWHPDGKHIFLQVEREGHSGSRELAQPGRGRFNEIWATTVEGDRWWKLTDYSKNDQSGVLFPVPSNSGKRLAWAQRFAGPRRPFVTLAAYVAGKMTKEVWGRWRLNIADIRWDENGNPSLEDVQQLQPGEAAFYEMQDWSLNDDKIYFASEINRNSPYVLDIWELDLDTKDLRPITDTSDHWEEHIAVSPDGKRFVFMSSECCEWDPSRVKTLVAELYLADIDGSNRVRLTHFNSEGFPESTSERTLVMGVSWAPDGRRVAFAKRVFGKPDELWILTFEGACGNSSFRN